VLMNDGFSGFSEGVAAFDTAVAGGFAIEPEGGQALTKAADDLYRELDDGLRELRQYRHERPLGSTPAAQTYKPFLVTVSSDPAQGAIPAFVALQKDIDKFKAAVNKAMETYQNMDHSAQSDLRRAGGTT
jgi:hypothetical protein